MASGLASVWVYGSAWESGSGLVLDSASATAMDLAYGSALALDSAKL
jgi:hypothetical protein